MATVQLLVPTADDISAVCVGNYALNPFGEAKRVVEVFGRGVDVHGKAYVCYYTEFGDNAKISSSMKEDELCRTAATSHYFKSVELDDIERTMLASGERVRFLEVHP